MRPYKTGDCAYLVHGYFCSKFRESPAEHPPEASDTRNEQFPVHPADSALKPFDQTAAPTGLKHRRRKCLWLRCIFVTPSANCRNERQNPSPRGELFATAIPSVALGKKGCG